MTKGSVALVSLSVFCAGLLEAQPDFDQKLTRVRGFGEQFENHLPDFVCRERITSRNISEPDGSVDDETIIGSVFTGRQNHSALRKLGGTAFIEERHIEEVNGIKSSDKDMPKNVFRIGGGYSSRLVSIFGTTGMANYSFSLAEPDSTLGKAFVAAFISTNSRQKIKGKTGSQSFRSSGRAWFDPDSLEPIRLEEHILPDGNTRGEIVVTVEYMPVRIGEGEFRMPVRVAATAHRVVAGNTQRGEYLAEYSDYHRYESSSTIQYPNVEK